MSKQINNPYRKSPFKKKITGKVSSKNQDAGHLVTCIGFPPTMIELYQYLKTVSGQTKENYTYPYRKHFLGDDESFKYPELEEHGFIGFNYMRDSDGQPKNGVDGYRRYLLVRCVPEGNISSSDTRMEGLNVLSAFFKSKKVSKYPPSLIKVTDLTCDPVKALDEFMLDKDIFSLLNNIFEEDALTPQFCSKFPAIAPVLFGGPTYPTEAIERLGYSGANPLNGPNGSYAPDFFPPNRDVPVGGETNRVEETNVGPEEADEYPDDTEDAIQDEDGEDDRSDEEEEPNETPVKKRGREVKAEKDAKEKHTPRAKRTKTK